MKKLLSIGCLVLGLILTINTHTSAQSFQESDIIVNAGIGLGSTYSWVGLSLPIGGGLEYGVKDLEVGSIGVGGDIGFISGGGLTITYLGAKGSYHFNELFELEDDNLDIYGGLGIYYRNFSYSGSGSSFASGAFAAFHIGSRYYFSDNIGGYAELGNNWGWLNAGIVFRL